MSASVADTPTVSGKIQIPVTKHFSIIDSLRKAAAADSVFTNDGGTTCFTGNVEVVDVVLVVVLVVVATTPTAVALAIVVVVEAIELSTNVNSVVTT